MKNRLLLLFIAGSLLILGALIYFVSRPDTILLNYWLHDFLQGPVFDALGIGFRRLQVPHWFIYSLPDGLWMASLIIVILNIWNFRIDHQSIRWTTLAFVVGLMIEILQAVHVIPGTFDVIDVIFLLLGALLPLSFTLIKVRS